MAFYTYDEQADALYVLLVPDAEAAIERTVELGERLHVDLGPGGDVVGVEILYPKRGAVDLTPLKERYGLDLRLPFSFAA
ncbi:MAG: DUF2283 domain-containing protein [Actinobacteria bacterium]|nr:DUF2283 domain-containing protein [Actinomycetota bacterium]